MIFLNIYFILTTAIIVFFIIVISLIIILLFAKNKLIPSGEVQIKINSDKEFSVQQGKSLLKALSEENIFIPSACGGKGSCGVCKCKVLNGGGSVLPTEIAFLTRKEQNEKWRLSCQVKIKDNMDIFLPISILETKKYECEVVSNESVATYIKELILKLPENQTLKFNSGEYIQIDVPKIKFDFRKNILILEKFVPEWEKYKIFDLKVDNHEETSRAYSMSNYPAENNIIRLNVRLAVPPFDKKKNRFKKINPGICSSYLFSLKPKDKVFVAGPFGDFHIKNTDREIVFIGGGAGMAPMRSHIFDLFYTKNTNRNVSFWYGARSLNEIFYQQDFENLQQKFKNFKFNIALSEAKPEDNWNGYKGFIHNVLYENFLKNHQTPEEIEYYLCGPKLMTEAVLKMLDNLGVNIEMIIFDDFEN